MQADRRRINPPAGGTAPPVFSFAGNEPLLEHPTRERGPDEHRKIFLRTGVVPCASGSAYYEVSSQAPNIGAAPLVPSSSHLKITCTVHGPRPLPRNAAFSSNLLLTTHVKFAPFASRKRRGYIRDASERDLGVHLETALRGVIIGERWPKSACEVVITVLEGEEDVWWGESLSSKKSGGWGMMSVLAGCITVACAALGDAGIDCVDLVSGGVAALVSDLPDVAPIVVIDPSPTEHGSIAAACAVGYLQSRDEVTAIWMKGDANGQTEALMEGATKAAIMTRSVLTEAIKEAVDLKTVQEALPGKVLDEAQRGSKGKDFAATE